MVYIASPPPKRPEGSTEITPKLYLGTMTFAWNQSSSPVGESVATELIQNFEDAGGKDIDTARIYAGGASEKLLGGILADFRWHHHFSIGTKVGRCNIEGN